MNAKMKVPARNFFSKNVEKKLLIKLKPALGTLKANSEKWGG